MARPTNPVRYPSLAFALPSHVPKFGPRVGRLALGRHGGRGGGRDDDDDDGGGGGGGGGDDGSHGRHGESSTSSTITITIATPNILVTTSRGVIPHLSRDHTNTLDAIRWIHVPFESFLEQTPPVPTLQDGPCALHRFLGFDEGRHVASLCLRDPLDMREMPPNGNTYVSANCVRGVKKVTLFDWRAYVDKVQPDVVFALTDTPWTPPPYSQKRITKSIERSAAWVADLLRPLSGDAVPHPLNVFVHMAGGTSIPAREAFAYGLCETLHGPEAEAVKPLACLDDGISGYAFDLAVLRGIKPSPNTSQHQTMPNRFFRRECPDMVQHPEPMAEALTPSTTGGTSPRSGSSVSSMAEPGVPPHLAELLKASLGNVSERKPRLVTGIQSPHEMVRLVRDVGVDLFDASWAVHAASLGVALDFGFPVAGAGDGDGRRELGHNLYDAVYARQFGRLAETYVGAGEGVEGRVCSCIACSPRSPTAHVLHSVVDGQSYAATSNGGVVRYEKPYTRAYIHHLLHTHEMSAHTFLVAHNIAVVSAFLEGVRDVWQECDDEGQHVQFALEVERFSSAYDESGELFVAAQKEWENVDKARGKGRLAREREKQKNGDDD